MTEIFNSEYAKQFLTNNSDTVENWGNSPDPVRAAIAILIKQTAWPLEVA